MSRIRTAVIDSNGGLYEGSQLGFYYDTQRKQLMWGNSRDNRNSRWWAFVARHALLSSFACAGEMRKTLFVGGLRSYGADFRLQISGLGQLKRVSYAQTLRGPRKFSNSLRSENNVVPCRTVWRGTITSRLSTLHDITRKRKSAASTRLTLIVSWFMRVSVGHPVASPTKMYKCKEAVYTRAGGIAHNSLLCTSTDFY